LKEEAMTTKQVIHPDRVRKIPKQFSWIDGRFVRSGYLDKCKHSDASLYLFLITVSDARGLSYYSDKSVCKRLSMDSCLLSESRLRLIQLDLIAYKNPLYQVLDLELLEKKILRNIPGDSMQSIGQLLKQIVEVTP
jgi:hypothetical protein